MSFECVLEGWEQAKVATLGRPGHHVCPGYGVAASRPSLQGCRSWGRLPLEAGTCLSQRSDGGSEQVSGTPCQSAFDFLLCPRAAVPALCAGGTAWQSWGW